MEKGACYLLFKNFESPAVYSENDVDLEMLCQGDDAFFLTQSYVQCVKTLVFFLIMFMHDLFPDEGILNSY